MGTWWATLSEPLRWLWALALAASVLLALQLALTATGRDPDGPPSGGAANGAVWGRLPVATSLMALLAGFGWGGILALGADWSLPRTLAAAVVASLVMAAAALPLATALRSRGSGDRS